MNIENQVNLSGRLVKNNEVKPYQNQNGQGSILRNTIAVNRRNKDDRPNFFDFTAWGKTAEYLRDWSKKGDKIAIFGELNQNVWTDESGQNRYYISINVETAKIIARVNENQGLNNQKSQDSQESQQEQKKYGNYDYMPEEVKNAIDRANTAEQIANSDDDEIPF